MQFYIYTTLLLLSLAARRLASYVARSVAFVFYKCIERGKTRALSCIDSYKSSQKYSCCVQRSDMILCLAGVIGVVVRDFTLSYVFDANQLIYVSCVNFAVVVLNRVLNALYMAQLAEAGYVQYCGLSCRC